MGLRSIAWALLLAFTAQTLVTQTHIHLFDGGAAIVKMVGKGAWHAKGPFGNGGSGCRFCQAVMHASTFSTPPTPSFVLPLRRAEVVGVRLVADAIDSLSTRHWHSRAPPQH